MRRKLFIISAVVLSVVLIIFGVYASRHRNRQSSGQGAFSSPTPVSIQETPVVSPTGKITQFQPPLDRASQRVTKKPFGIYVTPKNSPVQPERFTGYHTGVDFEIFPAELNTTVSIKAVCSGQLVLKETASGYGGVAVASCVLNSEPITVIYGHLKLGSISKTAGDPIKVGEELAVLGADHSAETGGERKHLHLGFHKGTTVNIRGYVQNQTELSVWIDPCLYVCGN